MNQKRKYKTYSKGHLIGIPTSASFKIATIWLSVFRLLIVKLLSFSLKEILRVICIILRGSYT